MEELHLAIRINEYLSTFKWYSVFGVVNYVCFAFQYVFYSFVFTKNLYDPSVPGNDTYFKTQYIFISLCDMFNMIGFHLFFLFLLKLYSQHSLVPTQARAYGLVKGLYKLCIKFHCLKRKI